MARRIIREKLARLNEEAAPVLQPVQYLHDDKRPADDLGSVAFDVVNGDYIANFPASPSTGATKGISDGEIMQALERLGNSLDVKMTDVAKKLKVPLTALTIRVYSNPVLMSFYKTIRRARAHLVKEERDRITAELVERAEAGDITDGAFKALTLKLNMLDRDLRVMDRELYGSGKGGNSGASAGQKDKKRLIEAEATAVPVISTSLE